MTLSELQAKRDAVLTAIDIASATIGDETVVYITEKRRTLELLDAEIAKAGSGAASRVFTIQTKRGLES